MSILKTTVSINGWTAVAQNTVVQSAVYDCSLNYETILDLQAFLDSTTAHASGTEFIILGSGNDSGDADWQEITRFTDLVSAAAVTQNLTNNPAPAGTTLFTCSTTTGFTVAGAAIAWRAIKDGTLANSELFLQTAVVASTSVSSMTGSVFSHVQNTPMWNTATSRIILIPSGFKRVTVSVNNNYTSSGSSLNFKLRANAITNV